MKIILLYLGFILFPITLFATTIKGKVTDEKGEPLRFAAVFIKGTQNGMMADEQGNYELSVAPGNYILVCRFTAYKPVEKSISVSGNNQIVNFQLQTEKLTIREVTIKADAEDPAYEIMRKVIAKRKYHETLVKTRETDIYLKGNLRVENIDNNSFGLDIPDSTFLEMGLDSSGSGIIYLLEEQSHYTFQTPDNEYNRVVSVKESGDPQGLGFARMPPILNIYQNNVNVLGLNQRGFISPANGGAFHYYRFKYLGSFEQFGRTIDKIEVIPKRKFEPCFSGYVYVAEGDWVFQNVDLILTKESQISGVDTIRLTQTFQPEKKDLWMIQNQVLSISMRILGVRLHGSFLTVYQNQQINQPVDEQLFAGKVISVYDSTANKKDSAYWAKVRPVPMKEEEKRNFDLKDSLYHVEQLKSDSAKKQSHYNFGLAAFLAGNPGWRYKSNEIHMRPLASAVQYNTVEGLSATLDLVWNHKFKNDTGKTMKLRWLNRYGFHNHHFNSLLEWELKKNDPDWIGRFWEWKVTVGQYVYQMNPMNPIMPLMNEVYTLLSGRNYLKLFENRKAQVSFARTWGNGLAAGGYLSYEQRMPLENTTDYSFREQHDPNITPNHPPNMPMLRAEDAAILAFVFRYQPGVHYIQYPDFKQPVLVKNTPTFSLQYKQGIPIANAPADFAKWQLSMTHSIRMRMAGHVDYRVATGGFLWKNVVNLPDWKHINGNQTILSGPYLNSFQLAPYYRFSNLASLYGEGHLEWHLDGLFTNKIPLFRRLNWFLVGASNVLYIDGNNYYAEVSVGLENIGWGFFRFGRVDFVAGYEAGMPRPTVGFRIGFSGLFNAVLGTQSTENL